MDCDLDLGRDMSEIVVFEKIDQCLMQVSRLETFSNLNQGGGGGSDFRKFRI